MADDNQTVYPGGSVGLSIPEGVSAPDYAPISPRTLLGQGALWGWGDELEGWVRSKLGKGTPEEYRQKALTDVQQFAEKYPVDAAYQELLGGAIPTAVATFFPPAQVVGAGRTVSALNKVRNALAYKPGQSVIKRGALVGGGAGLVGGAGTAEPDSRGTGALWGAGTGLAFGVGLPMAAATAGHAGRWMLNELLPQTERRAQREAERFMLERMAAEDTSPASILAQHQYDTSLGVPSMIAHQTPKITTGIVAKAGTPEAARLEQDLIQQQKGSRQRVKDRIKQALQPADYAGREEELVHALRNNASPHYEAAYAFGEVNDPLINNALTHSEFKAAFAEAQKIAENEAHLARLRGQDPAPFKLRNIYEWKETSPGVFTQEATGVVPDVRTLDYMHRGIDAIIEQGYKSGGIGSARARGLKEIRNEVMNRLDAIVPEFKMARKTYSGDANVLDAFHDGRDNFLSSKIEHEDISKFFSTASDAEKEAYRTGAVRNLWNRIESGRTETKNAASDIIFDNNAKQRMRAMFDSDAQFDLFTAAMERDARIYSGMSKAIEGSNTAPKNAAIEAIESSPSKIGGVYKSLANLVSGFVNNSLNVPPEVHAKMAQMLRAGTPAEVAAVVQALEKRAKSVRPWEAAKEAVTLGTVAGSSGATTLPEIGTSETSGGDILVNEGKDFIINNPINPWRPKQEGE
jgi:hypothetical protein